MGGESEKPKMVKMELDKEGHKEEEKKSAKVKNQGKGVKRKHNEGASQKKKESFMKAYIRRVQAYKRTWKDQKEKREIPLPTATK